MPSYRAAFDKIRNEWNSQGEISISRFHMDYERPEMAAGESVFGESYIYGCLFHFVRAVLSYLRKNTPLLNKFYMEKEPPHPIREWVWVEKYLY